MPSTINFFGNKFELYYIGYLLAIPIRMLRKDAGTERDFL